MGCFWGWSRVRQFWRGIEWNNHSGFRAGVVALNGKPFLQQRNWAKSTKLAQTSTWAHLTNTGKVLAWPGIEPGTFFCHGRCSNHWATAPCPEILSILVDDPYTSHNFPYIISRVPWRCYRNGLPFDATTPARKIRMVIPFNSFQNFISRRLTHMHLCI